MTSPRRSRLLSRRTCTIRVRAWDQTIRACVLGFWASVAASSVFACSGDDGGPGKGKHGGKAGGRHGGPGMAPQEEEPMLVRTETPTKRDVIRYYRTSGTLQAKREAEIRPEQAGIILSIEVEEGDRVKSGQLLARLDSREIELQAARDALTARNAQEELARLEKIAALDVIPQEELDKQRFAVKTATAGSKLTQHQVRQRTIRAPFAGTITTRQIDIGNMATSSTALFKLADLSQLELELHLPERDAAFVRVGAPVELSLVDQTQFVADVLRKAPVVDPLTGTVKLTVRATKFPAAAMPGAFVQARIEVERKRDVTSVPTPSTFELEGERFVFVANEDKAQRRLVHIGLRGEDYVEVLDGLQADDQVLLDPIDIEHGTPIRLESKKKEKASPTGDTQESGAKDSTSARTHQDARHPGKPAAQGSESTPHPSDPKKNKRTGDAKKPVAKTDKQQALRSGSASNSKAAHG